MTSLEEVSRPRLPRRPARRRGRLWGVLRGLGLAALAGAGACTYRGAIDEPVTLKVTWFSYLNGDDIRSSCVAGLPPRYRIVYNGDYDQQLRSYEVTGDGAGGAYLTTRVLTGGGIDLTKLSISDIQAPGRWTKAQTHLSPAEFGALDAALARSGAFAAAPDGLRLASEEFYWIFVGCRNGKVHFNAWRYPSDRYAALAFPAVLMRHDATGIALNPARDVGPAGRLIPGYQRKKPTPRFDLQIGANGLRGIHPLL
jgi:hypothetical protein